MPTPVRFFLNFLGQWKVPFAQEHFKQMMAEPPQYHPSVCGFYMTYAAFHLFQIPAKRITGGHVVNVLSFIDHYM